MPYINLEDIGKYRAMLKKPQIYGSINQGNESKQRISCCQHIERIYTIYQQQ